MMSVIRLLEAMDQHPTAKIQHCHHHGSVSDPIGELGSSRRVGVL